MLPHRGFFTKDFLLLGGLGLLWVQFACRSAVRDTEADTSRETRPRVSNSAKFRGIPPPMGEVLSGTPGTPNKRGTKRMSDQREPEIFTAYELYVQPPNSENWYRHTQETFNVHGMRIVGTPNLRDMYIYIQKQCNSLNIWKNYKFRIHTVNYTILTNERILQHLTLVDVESAIQRNEP